MAVATANDARKLTPFELACDRFKKSAAFIGANDYDFDIDIPAVGEKFSRADCSPYKPNCPNISQSRLSCFEEETGGHAMYIQKVLESDCPEDRKSDAWKLANFVKEHPQATWSDLEAVLDKIEPGWRKFNSLALLASIPSNALESFRKENVSKLFGLIAPDVENLLGDMQTYFGLTGHWDWRAFNGNIERMPKTYLEIVSYLLRVYQWLKTTHNGALKKVVRKGLRIDAYFRYLTQIFALPSEEPVKKATKTAKISRNLMEESDLRVDEGTFECEACKSNGATHRAHHITCSRSMKYRPRPGAIHHVLAGALPSGQAAIEPARGKRKPAPDKVAQAPKKKRAGTKQQSPEGTSHNQVALASSCGKQKPAASKITRAKSKQASVLTDDNEEESVNQARDSGMSISAAIDNLIAATQGASETDGPDKVKEAEKEAAAKAVDTALTRFKKKVNDLSTQYRNDLSDRNKRDKEINRKVVDLKTAIALSKQNPVELQEGDVFHARLSDKRVVAMQYEPKKNIPVFIPL